MKTRFLTAMVVVLLPAIVGPASAQFNSPTLLYQTPTADVLPAGALAISADLTFPLLDSGANAGREENANLRFSPVKHLDFGVTAYSLKDYVLDAKYQIIGGEPGQIGLAAGVYDVGIYEYVSPIGHGLDNAWRDWKYQDRTKERFSAYAVTSIPVMDVARLHVGLGRGRFVGYGDKSRYLNTDVFFDEHHQWAIGLFGGVEVYVHPKVALVAEVGGRDLNSGIKASFGPISATVAWTKMEGLLFSKGDDRFGRLQLGASYQLDNAFRRQEPDIPLYHVAPAPEPALPPVAAPVPVKPYLYPIWFMWDKWDITPVAAATLRKNADMLRARPELKVLITGYASEEGSPDYNLRLSERRAQATYEYLKELGVPEAQMRYEARGVSVGRPYAMHRSVYFEIEE